MRSIEETQSRWQATQNHNNSLADLQRAVKDHGSSNPCLSGCRSVCWKTFLLSSGGADTILESLQYARKEYEERRDHLLRFIRHPEALAEVAADPLADDPDSPWNAVRQDEIVRAEILQDVQRLPEEANYHDEAVQGMILDILFVYCKVNPSRGGYRQGMHELLAPMVHVVEQDAVNRGAVGEDASLDAQMLEMLDSQFIEHDAFALFSTLMENAQAFYQVADVTTPSTLAPIPSFQEQTSAIVERSKVVHQVYLEKIDPELAAHLTSIEVLPQIFLIRWMRLLFSREFPFNQFLALWDTIFAVNPSLDLIDLICCAMLIRIRWRLLEADYSVCLQLLLKYPPPTPDNSPQTFVTDALYLRDHLDKSGGEFLITKYTGRKPSPAPVKEGIKPGASVSRKVGPSREGGYSIGSPLLSPSRLTSQQASVESLFRGAAKGAKGVLERGEKLGINQAVREALGEIRRNVQDYNEGRNPPRPYRAVHSNADASKALTAIEQRNKQLASLLDETVADLKAISSSNMEDKAKSLERLEVVAAKVQFVQIHLEDSSMELQTGEPSATPATKPGPKKADATINNDVADARSPPTRTSNVPSTTAEPVPIAPKTPPNDASKSNSEDAALKTDEVATDDTKADPLNAATAIRPPAPIPTRSTLAQSSFSYMLEPDQSANTPLSPKSGKSPPTQHKKRHSNNISRERNAFLFGEIDPEGEKAADLDRSNQMFGLEPLQRVKEA